MQMKMKRFLVQGAAIGLALSLAGCGGDDDGGATGDGTVTEAWAGFCTATFTEDTQVQDGFGDPLFTARAGSEYLMSNDSFGVELLYLTSAGPETFEIERDDAGDYPFTSNCAEGAGVPYTGVFTDVRVFAEEALTTKICDVAAGTAVPGGSTGYASVGGFDISGPATYEIFLGGLAEQCGGAESGFVSVPQTFVFGSHTWLVPIQTVLHP